MPNNFTVPIQRLSRGAIYAIPIAFFFLIGMAYVNPSGVRKEQMDLKNGSVTVSRLFPAQRLDRVTSSGQRMLVQPVYFTVAYPLPYRTADITVQVENPHTHVWQIGLASKGAEDWSYVLANPSATGNATFALSSADVRNGSLRFMITVPELRPEEVFVVKNISVTLTRPTLVSYILSKLP